MAETSLKDRLIESTVVDPTALDAFEKSDILADVPLWMLVMIALLFAIAGIGAMKDRTDTQKKDRSGDDKH
jgi:hypothetical protein